MFFSLFLLVISFIFFLFFLYVLSHDDHVFLRKGVTMEQLFNGAFITIFIGIFMARLFYALTNPMTKFLNPLYFFLFPYFPGLSLTGGIIGAVGFVYFYYSRKKMPYHRIFDFFIYSFLFSATVGILIYKISFFIQTKSPLEFIFPAILFILFLFIWKIIFPIHRRGELKDGSLGFLILSLFSIIYLISDVLSNTKKIFYRFNIEDFLLIAIIIVSLFFLNNQEKVLQKMRNLWK